MTLFVKNLSFSTTDETLKAACEEALGKTGELKSAKVVVKQGGKSAGFGFVETDSAEAAERLVRQLEGHMLEGHALRVSLSTGRKVQKVEKQKS